MTQLLKNIYHQAFFNHLCQTLKNIYTPFDEDLFFQHIYDKHWEAKALKTRMYHIAIGLHLQLPNDYPKAVEILLQLVQAIQAEKKGLALEYMFIPEYIERYGLDDYSTSIPALAAITKFTSSEFAIRPFIVRYPAQTMSQLLVWSKDKHHCVRRLASEGCRPRLPWAMALPAFKNDPSLILPILENLKNDPSEFVRKSVANNLNDLSKDNPLLVIELAKKWHGKTKNTDWIVKHASRTLLKQGNQKLMRLFGFGSTQNIQIMDFVCSPTVKIGDYLPFSFHLHNQNKTATKIRLEYALYYLKANGSLSKKVFKISEKSYPPNTINLIQKRQSFKIISTRKFHLGRHQIAIIVNGCEYHKIEFGLV